MERLKLKNYDERNMGASLYAGPSAIGYDIVYSFPSGVQHIHNGAGRLSAIGVLRELDWHYRWLGPPQPGIPMVVRHG